MKELLLASLVFLSGCVSMSGTSYEKIKTGMYRDGGTVWVELKEKGNERIQLLCIDRQIGSKTPLEMYSGARHPTEGDAKLLAESERIEWIGLLKKYLPPDSEEHSRFVEVLNEHIKYKGTEAADRGNG